MAEMVAPAAPPIATPIGPPIKPPIPAPTPENTAPFIAFPIFTFKLSIPAIFFALSKNTVLENNLVLTNTQEILSNQLNTTVLHTNTELNVNSSAKLNGIRTGMEEAEISSKMGVKTRQREVHAHFYI